MEKQVVLSWIEHQRLIHKFSNDMKKLDAREAEIDKKIEENCVCKITKRSSIIWDTKTTVEWLDLGKTLEKKEKAYEKLHDEWVSKLVEIGKIKSMSIFQFLKWRKK